MRGHFFSAIAMVTLVPSILQARSDEIPTLDVRPVCRGIASQSADPGVGQSGQADTFRRCVESEQAVREQVRQEWPTFLAADKRHCSALAKTGGESSYTELISCLEMARDVRVLRLAAAAPARADTTQPVSSPSMPPVQPVPAEPAPQPTPEKKSTKTEGDQAKRQVERAQADAQSSKASEALVQRKLADAEVALQRAKEEVGRATAEAERAKADAKVARESEVVAKHKLADAEAARVAAEQSCHSATKTRPVLGQFRRWLRRPDAKNP